MDVERVRMGLSPFDPSWLGSDRTAHDEPHIAGALEGDRILVPLLDSTAARITDQIRVAATLARATDGSLRVLKPIASPDPTGRAYRERVGRLDDDLVEWALEGPDPPSARAGRATPYDRQFVRGIRRAVTLHDTDTLVLPGESSGRLLNRKPSERLAALVDCDVVVVDGRSGYGAVPSVLLPIAGGPHSGLAADVARSVAADQDAWIDVLHVVEEGASDRRREAARRYVDAAYRRVGRPETTTTWILEADDADRTIVEQSTYYDLVVIGAPTAGHLTRFVRGSTNRTVRADSRSVVLSARNHDASPPEDG